ncbi:MAG: hypothetical protein V3T41_06860 [bacterium]
MLGAALEISVQCPKCDAGVPLNGPLLRIHCDKCRADFALKPPRQTSPYIVKMYERAESQGQPNE